MINTERTWCVPTISIHVVVLDASDSGLTGGGGEAGRRVRVVDVDVGRRRGHGGPGSRRHGAPSRTRHDGDITAGVSRGWRRSSPISTP